MFETISALLLIPYLSRDRESELAWRIKEGDREARNELICANLRFVVDVARRYCNRGVVFPI